MQFVNGLRELLFVHDLVLLWHLRGQGQSRSSVGKSSSLIPGTYICVEGENQPHKVVPCPPHMCWVAHTCTSFMSEVCCFAESLWLGFLRVCWRKRKYWTCGGWLSGLKHKIKLWRLGKQCASSPGCLHSRDRAVIPLQPGRGACTTSTVTGLLLEIFNSGARAHQGLIFQLPKRQFSRQMNLSTVGMKMFPK